MSTVLDSPGNLEYRKGVPDSEGYWWLLPDMDFVSKTDGFLLPAPQIVRVLLQSDIGQPELLMQGRNGRLEAWLFTGLIAGPVPEPNKK